MRRVVVSAFLGILLTSLLVLGASETLTNRTGRTARAVIVTFSDKVRITSYDDSVFTIQEPSNRAEQFTFSGGELEHGDRFRLTWSPSSASIADHEWITTGSSSTAALNPATLPPHDEQCPPDLEYINITWWWANLGEYGRSRARIIQKLQDLEQAGWDGVSLVYYLFVDDLDEPSVYPFYEHDPAVGEGRRTPTNEELVDWLGMIRAHTDLAINLQVQLYLTYRGQAKYDKWVWRGELRPRDPDDFFDGFAQVLQPVLEICNEYEVDIFTPMVELNSLEQHGSSIRTFLDQLDPWFDGWFGVNQSTNHYLLGNNTYSNERRFAVNAGSFWDWVDEEGRPLIVQMSANELPLSTTGDSSIEEMANAFVEMYWPAVEYYRANFPEHCLMLGEVAVSQMDGCSMGFEYQAAWGEGPVDHQEMADTYLAIMLGARRLGIPRFSIQYYEIYGSEGFVGWIPESVMEDIEALLDGHEAGTSRHTRLPDVALVDWEQIPASLIIPQNAAVRYQYERSPDLDLSESHFWGESGKDVESFGAALVDPGLALDVQLREGESVGRFGFVFAFPISRGTTFYVFVRPAEKGGTVNLQTPTGWVYLGPIGADFYVEGEHYVHVLVPWETLQGDIPIDELPGCEYSVHLEYIQGDRRELFFFDREGPVTDLVQERRDLLDG